MPASYKTDRWAVAGGALLGVGAWVNQRRRLRYGARLGSSEWAYIAAGGLFLSCLSVGAIFHRPSAIAVPATRMLPAQAMPIVGLAFLAFAIWRLGPASRHCAGLIAPRGGSHGLDAACATVVYRRELHVLTLLLAGRWAYTDVLADLAQAMRASVPEAGPCQRCCWPCCMPARWPAGSDRPLTRNAAERRAMPALPGRQACCDGLGQPCSFWLQRRTGPHRRAPAAAPCLAPLGGCSAPSPVGAQRTDAAVAPALDVVRRARR